MENDTGDTAERRRSNPRPALVTLQGWADVCKAGKPGQKASAAWLDKLRNRGNPGPHSAARFTASRDKRKWDYRKLGYADKPCYPRDYSKPISLELERFYKEPKD